MRVAINRTGGGARCGVRPGDQPTPGLWSSEVLARKGRLLCMFLEVPAGSKACLPCAGFWGAVEAALWAAWDPRDEAVSCCLPEQSRE